MATILESLRDKVVAWVKQASLEEIGQLPSFILNETVSSPEGSGNSRRRLPSKVRRFMTPSEGVDVRGAMKGLRKGTPEYVEVRDQIARELGFTRRQIAMAAVGNQATATKRSRKKF